jgi:uncharacterized protein
VTRFPIRRLRLRPGEEHRENVAAPIGPLSFGGEEYRPTPHEVPAELVVQRASTGDVFRLAFSTRLEGPCMRCLSPAAVDLTVDAQEYQATDPGDEDELRTEYLVDGELDLDAWVRDLVSLSVPDQILCRPDCAGLCPVCGKDLNLEPHEHDEVPSDPRWSALEALRSDRADD